MDELLQLAGNDEQIQKKVKTLLLFLFPKIGGKEYHMEHLPQYINRIQNRDAFLKLLHCGVATFTFSAEEARRFCEKPEERYQILADHRDDLDIRINYLEQIALGLEIQDPIGLCNTFIEEIKGTEEQCPAISIPRQIGECLYEIIKRQKIHGTHINMLEHLVDNTKSLSISETVLLAFLSEAGIWKKGIYFPDEKTARSKRSQHASDVFEYDELYDAKNSWLDSVRKVANVGGILETQKDVISILYRWGQLNNNDFNEEREYIMKCSLNKIWLIKFLRLFNATGNIRDLDRLILRSDVPLFIERVSKLGIDDKHIKNITEHLQGLLEEKETDNKSDNSE